jgi:acid phosphatase type 7
MLLNRLFIVSLLGAGLSGLVPGSSAPLLKTVLAQTAAPVLVGAGDITSCDQTRDEATAQLIDGIAGTVFTLGDNAYPDGTPMQFNNCYGPTWGRHKDRTRPSPGNHDYITSGAIGYYTYFGTTASPLDTDCTSNCKGYYSYNLGDWHIIVLNSELNHDAGSAQEQWLRADLTANQSMCTLAYWHKPRFSSGLHGNNADVQPFWQALYDYGADVVLNGHDHSYERFASQNPTGQADPRGIREFVVGTGGAALYSFLTIRPNSEVRSNDTWGVLKLTLHPTSYDWEFIPVPGQTFRDSGTGNCVSTGPAQTLPSASAFFAECSIGDETP